MASSNQSIKCKCSTELQSTKLNKCVHCSTPFCYSCLLIHHHNEIKYEFMNMIEQIDKILAKFLHHAHNQTEWTDHLEKDRQELQEFIQFIDYSHKNLSIRGLPDEKWVTHVQLLIYNNRSAIFENCHKLMYPPLST